MDDTKVRKVKIRMVGLWDTVGAIGADAVQNKDANLAKSGAHSVRPTKAQEYGYHALAIDEHRPMFEATLWRNFIPSGDPTMKKVDSYAKYYGIPILKGFGTEKQVRKKFRIQKNNVLWTTCRPRFFTNSEVDLF